ncbi:MAG: hypothetical protein RIG84_10575 [Roseovarius sp.]
MRLRQSLLPLAALVLAACTASDDLSAPPPDLGDFRLAHNIIVAPNLTKGPLSRPAGKAEWIKAVRGAVDARLRRHEGEKLYNLGIALEGYVLAKPGVPVVASPKSVLLLRVTVWDDAEGTKLSKAPKAFTVFESLSGDTVVGSGLTLSKEEQMANLAQNAALQIERWLLRQKREEGWFEG